MLHIFVLLLLLYLWYKCYAECRFSNKYDYFAIRDLWSKAKRGLYSKKLFSPKRYMSFALSFWVVFSKPLSCPNVMEFIMGFWIRGISLTLEGLETKVSMQLVTSSTTNTWWSPNTNSEHGGSDEFPWLAIFSVYCHISSGEVMGVHGSIWRALLLSAHVLFLWLVLIWMPALW